MAELWDVYDRDGAMTGEVIERGRKLPSGKYHLIVHLWLKDPDGRLLIQQRNKPGGPTHELWAPTAGSITSGETSKVGVIRECLEEIGLDLPESELVFHEREFIADFIQDVWFAPWDGIVQTLTADPVEVLALRSVSWDEMMTLLREKRFIAYGEDYFQRLKTALSDMG